MRLSTQSLIPPLVGDERDFVRIAEVSDDSTNIYSSEIILEADRQYEVFIYFHNDADPELNDSEHDYAGAAWNTRLSSAFPLELAKGERQAITGVLTSTSTEPEAVWDEAYVTAKEPVELHYVTGSAKIYTDWDASGSVLFTNLFSDKDTFIGLNELNGLILAGEDFSGYVVYKIKRHPKGQYKQYCLDLHRICSRFDSLLYFCLEIQEKTIEFH